MTSEERKKFEDRCTIKSKEMFIETCRMNGIPDEWYAFHKDHSKPVCLEGTTVYADGLHIGSTSCSVPMRVWDNMFESLISYKWLVDWERSGERMKVLSISVDCEIVTAQVTEDKQYPFITIRKSSFYENDTELIAEGWKRSGYDQYMGEYNYSKVVDVRQWIPRVEVRFRKLTDDRDRMTFGFPQISMIGYYRYPTPPELLEEIGHDIYEELSKRKYIECLIGMELSSSVKKKMMTFLTEHLIEDEYRALCEIQQDLRMKDPRLSKKKSPIRTNVAFSRGNCVGWYDPKKLKM